MPRSVKLAVVLLALLTLLSAYGASTNPTPVGIGQVALGVLFLVLLPRGHPLARQWALFVASIFVLACATIALALVENEGVALVLVLSVLLILALMHKTAKRFFCLQCVCGSFSVRAADLLFNKIRCRKCDRRWTPRDYMRVDPSVFE